MEENIDASTYENNLNKQIKLPLKKKEINLLGSMTYWTTRIKEVIQWLSFQYIMEYTV